MQDLKRKSDKADVEPDPRRRSPSDRDVARSDMMDLTQSGSAGGKDWLMSEIKLMEDHYKVGRRLPVELCLESWGLIPGLVITGYVERM